MNLFQLLNHFACDQVSGFKYSAKRSQNVDFPLTVIVMMMMMMMMMMMIPMMMKHWWCNFLRSRQLSYTVLFFQYFQQAFYKLLITTRNFQSKFTPVTEGLLDVNFFCLETCSRKRLTFSIPTSIIIVTDIERAMQSILQFSWTPKLQ